MEKDFPGEKWKELHFDFVYTNASKIEISNFGRLRTFNKTSNGNIINGSMINGYRIIRLKFFKPREEKVEAEIKRLQKQLNDLTREIKLSGKENTAVDLMSGKEAQLKTARRQLNKVYRDDIKNRTMHYHSLIHRLVADYFLPKPAGDNLVVAHIDFNKLNNRHTNLKWMTKEENYTHQQKSPHVINEKQVRKSGERINLKAAKLTVTKVMLLKKLINQNKPMKLLTKQFKVTDTQILRIKRGENWKNVPAAD